MISEVFKFYAFVALLVAIFFILGLLWRRIDAYLGVKIGVEKWASIKDYAEVSVRAMEQNPAFAQLAGYQKKENVMLQLFNFATQIGLKISDLDRDKIIESAVQVMRSEQYLDAFDTFDGAMEEKITPDVKALG